MYVKVRPESVPSAAGFLRDVRTIDHYGTGDLEITVRSPDDLERAKPLIIKNPADMLDVIGKVVKDVGHTRLVPSGTAFDRARCHDPSPIPADAKELGPPPDVRPGLVAASSGESSA